MSDIVVGYTELVNQLTEVTPKEVTAAIRRGLRNGLKKHQKAAISNLRSSVPGATRPSSKFSDTLVDAIIMRVGEGDFFGDSVGVLHTMGTRAKGSGTYRTRFFEVGTKERWQKTWAGKELKKKRYLGKINSTGFFSAATAGVDATCSSEIQAALEKTIQKLNKL